MVRLFSAFARAEDGAVTVDWVVLTAAVVALNLVIIASPIGDALRGVAESIADVFVEASDFMKGAEDDGQPS